MRPLILVGLAVAVLALPASAGLRRLCYLQCGPAITECFYQGLPAGSEPDRRRIRRCRLTVRRDCRRHGLDVCATTTTTEPTTSSSTATTTSTTVRSSFPTTTAPYTSTTAPMTSTTLGLLGSWQVDASTQADCGGRFFRITPVATITRGPPQGAPSGFSRTTFTVILDYGEISARHVMQTYITIDPLRNMCIEGLFTTPQFGDDWEWTCVYPGVGAYEPGYMTVCLVREGYATMSLSIDYDPRCCNVSRVQFQGTLFR